MAKKKAPKPLWFFDPLYRQNYYFLRSATAESLSRFLKEEYGLEMSFNNNWDGKCITVETTDGDRYVLAVRQWDGSPRALSTLMHEANHAAMFCLEKRGVAISYDAQEPFTYLAQLIFETFLRLDA